MGRILQRSEPLEEKEFNALVKKWSKLSCPKCESQNLKWLYRHDSKDFYRCCKCLLEFADLEKYKKDQELEEFHRMKSDALIHHN
jgi:transposase-like protein